MIVIFILLLLAIVGIVYYRSSQKQSSQPNVGETPTNPPPGVDNPSSLPSQPGVDTPYPQPPVGKYTWIIDNENCDCTTGTNAYKCIGPDNEVYTDTLSDSFPCDNNNIPTSKCMTDTFCKPYNIQKDDVSITKGNYYIDMENSKDNHQVGYTISFPAIRGSTSYIIKLVGKIPDNIIFVDPRLSDNSISESLINPKHKFKVSLNTADFEKSKYKIDVYDMFLIGKNSKGESDPLFIGVLNLNYKYDEFIADSCDCTTGVQTGKWTCKTDEADGYTDPEVCRRMGLSLPPVSNCFVKCPSPSPLKKLDITRNKNSIDIYWNDTDNTHKKITSYTLDIFTDGVLYSSQEFKTPFSEIIKSDGYRLTVLNIGEDSKVNIDFYTTNAANIVKSTFVSQRVSYSWSNKLCDCNTNRARYMCLRDGIPNGVTTNTLNGICGNLTTPSGADSTLFCSVGCDIVLQPPQNLKATKYALPNGDRGVKILFDVVVTDNSYSDKANSYFIEIFGKDTNGYDIIVSKVVSREEATREITYNLGGINMSNFDVVVRVTAKFTTTDGTIQSLPSTVTVPKSQNPVIRNVEVLKTSVNFLFEGIESNLSYTLNVYNEAGNQILYSTPLSTSTFSLNTGNYYGMNNYTIYRVQLESIRMKSNYKFFKLFPNTPVLSYSSAEVTNENSVNVNISVANINYLRIILENSNRTVLSSIDVNVSSFQNNIAYTFNIPSQYGHGTYYYRVLGGYKKDIDIAGVIQTIDGLSDPATFTITKQTQKWISTDSCVCKPYAFVLTDSQTGAKSVQNVDGFYKGLACSTNGVTTQQLTSNAQISGSPPPNNITCSPFDKTFLTNTGVLQQCYNCPVIKYDLRVSNNQNINNAVFWYFDYDDNTNKTLKPNITPNYAIRLNQQLSTMDKDTNVVEFIPSGKLDDIIKNSPSASVVDSVSYYMKTRTGYLYVDDCNVYDTNNPGGVCRSRNEVKYSPTIDPSVDPDKYRWILYFDNTYRNTGLIGSYYHTLQNRVKNNGNVAYISQSTTTGRLTTEGFVGPTLRFSFLPV